MPATCCESAGCTGADPLASLGSRRRLQYLGTELISESRLHLDLFDGGDCVADYAKDVLVETQWVANHLDDDTIRIVEVDENPALYAEAHIPGAIGFDWKKDLQDQVKRDFLGPEEFGALFGSRGISNEHQ